MAIITQEEIREMEKTVLGELFIDENNNYLARAGEDLFSDPQHREAFKLLLRYEVRLDPFLLVQKMKLDGMVKDNGLYLHRCSVKNAIGVDLLPFHIRHLKDLQQRNRLLGAIDSIGNEYPNTKQIAEIHELTEEQREEEKYKVRSLEELTLKINDVLDERITMYQDGVPTKTGYPSIDRVIGGFLPGCLYVIGGRTAMGKTALMFNMACKQAEIKNKTIYFTCEMNEMELIDRLISTLNGIDGYKIKFGRITNDQIARIQQSFSKDDYFKNPLGIYYKPGLTIRDIERVVGEANPKVVFIDHIQLIQLGKVDNQAMAITNAMYDLKRLAGEKRIPVIIASQKNREGEKSLKEHDGLISLKGSGGIEEAADCVMLIELAKGENKTQNKNWRIEIKISKNRHGLTCELSFVFERSIMSFKEEKIEADKQPELKPEKERRDLL